MRTATLNRLLKNGNGHAPSTKPAKGKINPLTEAPAPVLATPPGAMTYLEAKAVCQLFGWPLPVDVGGNAGVFVVLATVTPEVAKGLLVNHNAQNRNENQNHIDVITREMSSGNWQLNHQPIAVDGNADLIDGQHRLAALLKYGKPLPFLIVIYNGRTTGITNSIDTGKPRTYLDHRAMRGDFTMNNHHQGMLRFLLGMATDSYGRTRYSSNALDAAADEYGEAVEFVLTCHGNHVKGVTCPMMAAVAAAYGHIPNEKIKRFMDVLSTSTASESDPAEQTILTLLKNQNRVNNYSTGARIDTFKRTQRALHAYANGVVLTKMYVPSSDELPYPVSIPKLQLAQLAG